MKKQSDKPPDVYPTDPIEMTARINDILDRHRKSEKQWVIAYCRQQDWIGRASGFFAGVSEKIGAVMQKAAAHDKNAIRTSRRRQYDC